MPILFSTAYFPPGGYMAEAIRSDEIVIEAFETYAKQTCRNHCTIFGPNGRQTLTIPVIRANGNHTPTRDILISDHQAWQRIHWKSIKTAYSNSPFFLFYQDRFEIFFERKYKYLLDLNVDILLSLLMTFRHSIPVGLTGSYQKKYMDGTDNRALSSPAFQNSQFIYPPYTQVFEPRNGFIPGLSILDLLFNLGPETTLYLETIRKSQFSLPLL